ncbi:hypothetical protein QEJ31_03755 [Pigmentibacter sp. JX0631]|uniref:hypothetical protein n=1 Tax=Pigmentibacter sp. JX0631 TaxID=2976982 RepID=UPI002468BE61|nr:hypothetical protein [Pigmentibacter sp. JX0631]WGL60718.1 hypothetical protein QEJ31_03755 [Pigmentibacter sp. JX0631]
MDRTSRVYTSLRNEILKNDINNVLQMYKADKFFNYIDANVINLQTTECINLDIDISGLTKHYQFLNIYAIDPFINQFKYTRKQTFHFKEIELSQVKMNNSNVRVGVVLNEERSKYFYVHNGMYRTIQINKKYCFVCVYGLEKKDFIFDVDFDPANKQGQWFRAFEFALLDVVKNYLIDIANNRGNEKCPILKGY